MTFIESFTKFLDFRKEGFKEEQEEKWRKMREQQAKLRNEKSKCSCELTFLMNNGCKCGAI